MLKNGADEVGGVLSGGSDRPGASEWRRGARTVLGASVGLATGYGLYATIGGVFIKPMAAEFGWPRSQLSFAPMVAMIAALIYPFAGIVVDRIGARRTAAAGLAFMGLCYLAFTVLPVDRRVWFAAILIYGFCAPFTGFVVLLSPVAMIFERWRGRALAIAMSGVSLFAAISLPLLEHIVSTAGWRQGFMLLAAFSLGLGVPVVLMNMGNARPALRPVGQEISSLPPLSGLTLRQAVATPLFWLITAGFVLASMPLGGFLSHNQPLLTDAGFSGATAARLGSFYAISIVFGRLLAGVLLDKYPSHLVAGVFLLTPALGAAILSLLPDLPFVLPLVGLAVFLFGFVQGAEVDFVAYFIARYFGKRHYARIFGVVIASVSLAQAVGGFGFGHTFDRTGSYRLAMQLCVGALIAASTLLFACGRTIRKAHPSPDADGSRAVEAQRPDAA